MKTIFIPTDYSTAAENAMNYGIDFAKRVDAKKIILFHAFHLPVPVAEVPQITVITYADIEKENAERLKKLKVEVMKKTEGIEVVDVVRAGFAVDEIDNAANENDADIIIMGMKGASKMEEILIGSNTTGLIKRSSVPVLVVPEKVIFKNIQNIVLSCDYKEEIANSDLLQKFKNIVSIFNASVHVLNVLKPAELASYEKAVFGLKIENQLKDMPHTLYFPENDDVVEGINSFVKSKNADLVVMFPRKRNIFERIFGKSNTKKVAFHTDVPLLSIHV